MARHARFFRPSIGPITGDEAIGALTQGDPVEGFGTMPGALGGVVKREQYAEFGAANNLVKIAHQVSASGSEYPDGGTGKFTGAGTAGQGSILLSSTALQSGNANLTAVPLLLAVTTNAGGGTALGEWRRVIRWDGSTKRVWLNRPWVTGRVPAINDDYELMLDCRWLKQIALKTEYSSTTNVATVQWKFWDFGTDEGAGTSVSTTTVTIGNDTVTATGHGFKTGDGPILVSSTGTLATPLDTNTPYWIIVVDANTVKLATSYANAAVTGTAIDLGGAPTGTFTMTPYERDVPRKPRVLGYDVQDVLDNWNITTDVEDAGFSHGRPSVLDIKGMAGAQLRLVSISAGTASFWAGAK